MTTAGFRVLLQQAVTSAGGLAVDLFVNAHDPTATDTMSAYALATFPGYQGALLAGWGRAYLDGAGSEIEAQPVTFAASGMADPPQRVFGYLVRVLRDDWILWAERTESAGFLMLPGAAYSVRPNLRCGSLVGGARILSGPRKRR